MAVDYIHRILVWGSHREVSAFAATARHRVRLRAHGREKARVETRPFSFEALWHSTPALRRVSRRPPIEPQYLRGWPVRRETSRLSFVRYQFQTRDWEIQTVVRRLSTASPALTFVLMTMCLDDGDVPQTWLFGGGSSKRFRLSDKRVDALVQVERERLGVADVDIESVQDEAVEDLRFDARDQAEYTMMDEATHHWDTDLFSKRALSRPAKERGPYLGRRISWWDREPMRGRVEDWFEMLLEDVETRPELAKLIGLDHPSTRRRT